MNTGATEITMGRILNKLIDYTKMHFKFEEDLFAKYGYEQAESHVKIHHELVSQLIDFQAQFKSGKADISIELMDFLKDWLVNHIKKTDTEYGPFLTSKGVR